MNVAKKVQNMSIKFQRHKSMQKLIHPTSDTFTISLRSKDWLQKSLLVREQCVYHGLASCTPPDWLNNGSLQKNCIVQKFQMDKLQRHWPRQREFKIAIAFSPMKLNLQNIDVHLSWYHLITSKTNIFYRHNKSKRIIIMALSFIFH